MRCFRRKPAVDIARPRRFAVVEMIDDHRGDTYRTVYTVRFAAAVYVLHAFQKKSKSGISTPRSDLDLIDQRLRDAAKLHKELKK